MSTSRAQTYNEEKFDSILYYLKISDNNKAVFKKREQMALRARALAAEINSYSLQKKSNLQLIGLYKVFDKNQLYIKFTHENLKLAEKFKDSNIVAHMNKNLGYYYFDKIHDSAHYYNNKAEKLFRKLNDHFNTAAVLLDVASLQRDGKDYTGSELTLIEGLKLLNKIEYPSKEVIRKKAYFYNSLGIVFNVLEQYDKSIEYQNKSIALKLKLKGDNKSSIELSKNNLGNALKEAGKYELAIETFKGILEDKTLAEQQPDFYVMVLDNYAHALYLSSNRDALPGLYHKALKVSMTLGKDNYKSIVILKHLAEYYHGLGLKDSAKYYAYEAKRIAEKFHNDDLLKSLLLLSEIEEGEVAANHLRNYVKLNDSLQKSERAIRNKFARIKYETNEIEEENVKIAKERMWLLIISIVIIIASFLLYIIFTQRNKNKELEFIQKQQETNEEIYNLMLSQNEVIEDARALEKKRISEELHDGVLGRLFGARLSLDSLNMNNSDKAIKTRGQYISELKVIEEDIRKVSHELNADFVTGSGFREIIKNLIETQTATYKISYKLDWESAIDWDEVSNKIKIHFYRIIQEALHNIYKHAKATEVRVSFKFESETIRLSIIDNGSGFDVNRAKSGIGLKNMKSRIKEINGTIAITSQKEEGTTVKIDVPTS
ncbi:sensor histidine kinase [Tamlana sp. 2_MG-2023]|uniref:tetratricopeptide repeat-containing sensor histidine kinase n=1 Tax=unclassified Tamlana TaxID=2614803 RepID=UPI0026E29B3E|nr:MULTISPECIES: sensor histidine kinase [unclassified Tamlana]MDO6761781.1 sensor histidine kinase [Tamlana sp. 2_MG-2023]MDO6792542.1 sensor histidine kinase [Tamlana sp. 1_MG-2023]